MTSPSEITYNAKGDAVCFAGRDAVELYRVAVLRSALGLLKKGITPTRGLTITRALAMATPYTGQTYKRTRSEIDRAVADLNVWVQTMKSAIPTRTQGE